MWFQSTHSLRSATCQSCQGPPARAVSIHALLAECDKVVHAGVGRVVMFQSTHSLRSATIQNKKLVDNLASFNPRTPCGVRLIPPSSTLRATLFQSTHSLRSATPDSPHCQGVYRVSIHALLAECDIYRETAQIVPCGFNPRTPCGVRLIERGKPPDNEKFQSTHSLRSATRRLNNEQSNQIVSIHALLAECD